jgi:deoxyribonuclease V
MWPTDTRALVTVQRRLAGATPPAWSPEEHEPVQGGCWVCFPRGISGPGRAGDALWSAAVVMRGGSVLAESVVTGEATAPYEPGLLALRVGAVLEEAVRGLPTAPEVVLVDAGGRDHPRRAGLAIHLGAALDTPTVGVTHRPLLARGDWPGAERGDTSELRIGDEVVGCWMRTQAGTRPLAVHPGWRTGLATAVALVEATTRRQRTPEPLRRARELARRARAADSSAGGAYS